MIHISSTKAVGIPSWSFKEFRARYTYCCQNCGGSIIAGTKYLRHVERLGSRRGKDPLRNIHVHLDCQAPWYQPGDLPHRLRQIGSLPGTTPPPEVYNRSQPFIRPSVAISNSDIGIVQWKLPAALEEKIAFCPSVSIQIGAVAEIEHSLTIVLTALVKAAGNKRESLKLSHLINEIASRLH